MAISQSYTAIGKEGGILSVLVVLHPFRLFSLPLGAVAVGLRERDRLFYYQLPMPQRTAYRELGLGPDASDEEVQAAKSAAVRRLLAEKDNLDRSLQAVYDKVPGLQAAYDGRDQASATAGDAAASRDARRRLAALEDEAAAIDPDVRGKRRRSAELETRINELNQQALEKPANRRSYDRAHPPLALLKLEDCAVAQFLEGRTCLHLLRKDVAEFVSERGEVVFHPSDLTREDFSSDFSFNPILDGPDDEPRRT